MDKKFNCNICSKSYIQEKRYLNHLRLHSINLGSQFTCQYCQCCFKHQSSLSRHENYRCQKKNEDLSLKEKMLTMEKQLIELTKKQEKQENDRHKTERQLAELKETTIELKKEPRVNNQILQVICIGQNDNYLDMLTEHWGSFDRALDYIKECALSNLIGDCKLIEKIYLGESIIDPEMNRNSSIRYVDKSRTKIQYFNEKKEKVIDNRESFGRKLANNLQNTYLKGVNYLITKNLENHRCPNKFLEEYDLQTWNQHIYNLSDSRYQKKIVIQLNIPQ